jgi:hypothetical protein
LIGAEHEEEVVIALSIPACVTGGIVVVVLAAALTEEKVAKDSDPRARLAKILRMSQF